MSSGIAAPNELFLDDSDDIMEKKLCADDAAEPLDPWLVVERVDSEAKQGVCGPGDEQGGPVGSWGCPEDVGKRAWRTDPLLRRRIVPPASEEQTGR